MVFKYIFVFFFVVYSACNSASTEGIKLQENTWEEILAKAKKQDKLIFFDAYASWCRPCQEMQYATFSDSSVAAFFNAKFINVKYDMEKGEGLHLAQKYQVRAYPTLLFLDANGTIVERLHGKRNATSFLASAQEIYQKYQARIKK